MIPEEHFRRVMGRFATGVTVVTGQGADGHYVGLTANSVTAVSLEPPLVLVCLAEESFSREVFLASSSFAISILRRGDVSLAHRFAGELRDARFSDLPVRTEVTGAPILKRSLAWLDCAVWRTVEAGDHTVLFGEVLACGAPEEASDPLVFFNGIYGTVTP
jgi:flavin reductase (DIM6/NTAB) family NADH-FMN oxidoreductase RutF